ncbi:hypothetical protein [Streptomyces mirabilis]|uniref:hypothetical protein n=1 Tax=Streptomyces mirabilis TaxID=68239 RepID=UPI0033C4BBEE
MADLQVFDDMVDMLGEIGRSERALDWCLAAVLASPAARENEGTGGGGAARLRRGPRISRALLRRGLGLEPTDDDPAAESENDAELREFGGELVHIVNATLAAYEEFAEALVDEEIDLRPGSGVVSIPPRTQRLHTRMVLADSRSAPYVFRAPR